MITPFTRAELLITHDLTRFSQVRDALAGAGVDYTYRCKDRTWDTRGRTGTLGMNQEVRVEYKLYVLKKDLERARAVIQGV